MHTSMLSYHPGWREPRTSSRFCWPAHQEDVQKFVSDCSAWPAERSPQSPTSEAATCPTSLIATNLNGIRDRFSSLKSRASWPFLHNGPFYRYVYAVLVSGNSRDCSASCVLDPWSPEDGVRNWKLKAAQSIEPFRKEMVSPRLLVSQKLTATTACRSAL